MSTAAVNASWPVQRGKELGSVRVGGNFVTNNGDVIVDAALAGLGVAMTAHWIIEKQLAGGRLVEVLADYAPTNRAVYAVLPRQGPLTPKVRAFVDFLKSCCADLQ